MHIQNDFFSPPLLEEFHHLQESMEKSRRRLFARLNDLESLVIDLQNKIEKLELSEKERMPSKGVGRDMDAP